MVVAAAGARWWAIATLFATAAAFGLAIVLAPPEGRSADGPLYWLLFVGSSVHVAATGWFYALPDVRAYARAQPTRYIYAPIALVAVAALLAAVLDPSRASWLLLGFFGWQFFHFHKQNLGLAALAAKGWRAPALSRAERWWLTLAGVFGIIGLVVHPQLLQLDVDPHLSSLFSVAAGGLGVSAIAGILTLRRRGSGERPAAFVAVYVISLLFFAPVFVFSSPYAAVGGITIAHGLQYLLLVGLVAGGDGDGTARVTGLAVAMNLALLGGLALNRASHLHRSGPGLRAVYGAYVGVVMAHFVVDAGLWRLRDEFPRRLLSARVPYLMGQRPPQ